MELTKGNRKVKYFALSVQDIETDDMIDMVGVDGVKKSISYEDMISALNRDLTAGSGITIAQARTIQTLKVI
jgi:hypothetical protein